MPVAETFACRAPDFMRDAAADALHVPLALAGLAVLVAEHDEDAAAGLQDACPFGGAPEQAGDVLLGRRLTADLTLKGLPAVTGNRGASSTEARCRSDPRSHQVAAGVPHHPGGRRRSCCCRLPGLTRRGGTATVAADFPPSRLQPLTDISREVLAVIADPVESGAAAAARPLVEGGRLARQGTRLVLPC